MKYSFPVTSNICFLIKGDEVLLIMKKRSFGKDKWNGPGGKVKEGEDLEAAVIREVEEETGLRPLKLDNVGVIEFVWPEDKGWNQRCYIYACREFDGELTETDEALPKWFKIKELPMDKMWDSDNYWLEGVLGGGKINKRFFFNGEGKVERFEELEIGKEAQEIAKDRVLR